MERWFDLLLSLANWGARRLMMRPPKREDVDPYLRKVDRAAARTSDDNPIIHIDREVADVDEGGNEDSDRLARRPRCASMFCPAISGPSISSG